MRLRLCVQKGVRVCLRLRRRCFRARSSSLACAFVISSHYVRNCYVLGICKFCLRMSLLSYCQFSKSYRDVLVSSKSATFELNNVLFIFGYMNSFDTGPFSLTTNVSFQSCIINISFCRSFCSEIATRTWPLDDTTNYEEQKQFQISKSIKTINVSFPDSHHIVLSC